MRFFRKPNEIGLNLNLETFERWYYIYIVFHLKHFVHILHMKLILCSCMESQQNIVHICLIKRYVHAIRLNIVF